MTTPPMWEDPNPLGKQDVISMLHHRIIFTFLFCLLSSFQAWAILEDKEYEKTRTLYVENIDYNYSVLKEDHLKLNRQLILGTSVLSDVHVSFSEVITLSPEDIKVLKTEVYSLKTSVHKGEANKYVITVTLFNESNKSVIAKATSLPLEAAYVQDNLGKMLKIIIEKLATASSN